MELTTEDIGSLVPRRALERGYIVEELSEILATRNFDLRTLLGVFINLTHALMIYTLNHNIYHGLRHANNNLMEG